MAFSIFCRAALKREPITVFGDGTQTRDFTFVSDVVAATRRAATAPDVGGNVYNVGGGAQIGLNDGIAVIEELLGGPLDVQRGPTESGDVRDTSADTTRAEADLGLDGRVQFREGLTRQFEWTVSELEHAQRLATA
jgi:UDP-glucuronate 4-epimerase